MNPIKYRSDIDGLRAVAVISVVIYHAFPAALPGGLVGVDIFFVISGYLINSLLLGAQQIDRSEVLDFYARRVKRIFPALLLVMTSCYAFGWVALYADEFKELGLHIASGAGFVSNITYLLEAGYFDKSSELKPLLHLWSLGIEEQFYLIWPIALVFIIKARSRLQIVALLWILSFSANIYLSYTRQDLAYYFPLSRFWEILTGAWISFYERDIRSKDSPTPTLSVAGLILILLAVFLTDPKNNFPGWQALFATAGAGMVILGHQGSLGGKLLSSRWLVYCGLISYPLYLWHWPVLSFLKITTFNPGTVANLVAVAASVLLAILTYSLIEKRVRRSANYVALILLFLMVFVGLNGANTYRRDGMNFREVNFSAYLNDFSSRMFSSDGAQPLTHGDDIDLKQFRDAFPEQAKMLALISGHLQKDKDFSARIKNNFATGNRAVESRAGASNIPAPHRAPVVYFVGDSFGANLFSAIRSTHHQVSVDGTFDNGCTPIRKRYRDEKNRCRLLMDKAFERVKQGGVDLLIFSARWPRSYRELSVDIEAFRPYVKAIAISGPSITFSTTVERILLRYDNKKDILEHLASFVEADVFALNREMKSYAKEIGVGYIDRVESMYSSGFFPLTVTGNELFIFDGGHLSKAGAEHVGTRLLEKNVISGLIGGEPASAIRIER